MLTIALGLACHTVEKGSAVAPLDDSGDTDVPVDTGTAPTDDTACVPEVLYADADGDGFGDPDTAADACPADGLVADGTDCDDTRADVNPDGVEVCDDVDQDCDGAVDEGLPTSVRYTDADGDGLGDPATSTENCHDDAGVSNALDCDDADPAEPVHVEAGADDTIADGTAAAPFPSLQEGIDAASVCVHVHAGTYVEDVDFVGKDIAVIGVDGRDATVLEGTGTAPVVTFASGEGADAVLTGFTITGGGGYVETQTETVDCDPDGPICTFHYITHRGGGLYVAGAAPTLEDLLVVGNVLPSYSVTDTDVGQDVETSFGGGLYADADAMLDTRWIDFRDNAADTAGAAEIEGSATFTNAIFSGNVAAEGGGAIDLWQGGYAALTNVTAYANDGDAVVYALAGAQLAIANTIVLDNAVGSCLDGEFGALLALTYSDVYGCSGGTYGVWTNNVSGGGNFNDDPLFVDAPGGDFTLEAASICVDKGDPAAEFNDVDGTRNDMGAFGGPEGSWP